MNAFWRQDSLELNEQKLLREVHIAHHLSCFRQNPSAVAITCAAQGSQDLYKSVAAGLMTFGGPHGPIPETYDILISKEFPSEIVSRYVTLHKKVPGWGMSFVRDRIDPIWMPVSEALQRDWPDVHARIDQFTEALHAHGKMVYPNPSAFTAAAAIAVKMPRSLSPLLLIEGRVEAWAELYFNATKGN